MSTHDVTSGTLCGAVCWVLTATRKDRDRDHALRVASAVTADQRRTARKLSLDVRQCSVVFGSHAAQNKAYVASQHGGFFGLPFSSGYRIVLQ